MKTLVHAIREYLSTEIWCEYFNAVNIFLAISEDLIPHDVGFPAIGIKDGPIEYAHEDAVNCRRTLRVALIVYQQVTADDEALTGVLAELADGVLAITDHLRAALTDNVLDITGMESALPVHETEVELAGTDFLVLRKALTMEYTHWEEKTWQP